MLTTHLELVKLLNPSLYTLGDRPVGSKIKHHILCFAVCKDQFTLVRNTLSLGGIEMPNLTNPTKTQCEDYCRSQTTCDAFDLDPQQGHCYWHDSTYVARIVASGVTGVNQYRRVRTC